MTRNVEHLVPSEPADTPDDDCAYCGRIDVLQEVEEHGLRSAVCWRCAAQVQADVCA